MLYATSGDAKKIASAVDTVLGCHALPEGEDENGKVIPHVYVNLRDFYRACELTSLPRSRFNEEVGDLLCGTEFTAKYGNWTFAEFGDGYWVFSYLGPHVAGDKGVDAFIDQEKAKGNAALCEFTFQEPKPGPKKSPAKKLPAGTTASDDEDDDGWD